jgi:CubicO group peptidase (beta-lactamase class C family)
LATDIGYLLESGCGHRFSYPHDAAGKRAARRRHRRTLFRVPSTPRTRPTRGEATDARAWRERLVERLAAHRVPGATLGILHGGKVTVTGAGVLSKATGVEVTPESLFQIGSITKVWTATLVLQLVDDGRLDLDAPVADVLPGFRVADPDVTRRVTTRNLLTHTSGIDGDVFTDTGRGDGCIARYVDGLADVGQNHPLGATWSYCNSGFVVCGRIVEHLTDLAWDAALRERLCAPLGLERTVTLPEDALLHRTAVGHVGEPDEDPVPTTTWVLPRSAGPAGLITASAEDVLAFARMHLEGGVAVDGTRVLASDSCEVMAAKEAELPDTHTLGDSWGLGWIRYGWDGERLVGHDGNTIGQSAFLRLLPSRDLAVVLLTNGGNTRDLFDDLYREIFREAAGVELPRPFEPPPTPPAVDPQLYVGRYERAAMTTEVFAGDEGLRLRATATGPLAELMPEPVHEFELVPVEPGLFALRSPGESTWTAVTFYELEDGSRYVHYGARANPLVGG